MDAYDILGVPPNSSKEECKAAYRRLASQLHPDKGGDTAKFQAVQVAWDAIEQGYRRFIRKGPEVSNTARHSTTSAMAGAHPRASSFSDVFDRFSAANSAWGIGPSVTLQCPASTQGFEHTRDGFTYNIPAGVPDGWQQSIKSRSTIIGQHMQRTTTFKVKLVVPHDPTMRIQGIDMTSTRLPYTNLIGDAVCAINTHAINLVLGAWVQIRDVFNKPHTIRIPEGFDPQHRLRISGAGYYQWDGISREPILDARGDLYVEVVPTFSKWEAMSETDRTQAALKLKEKMSNASDE